MQGGSGFFVITGGPGAGKTTLLQTLAAQGLPHMPEAGRAIIQDQQAIGGSALPWADRLAFAEQMLGWELRSWREAARLPRPVLFDRGLPDIIGYLTLCGLPVPAHFQEAARRFRYASPVFIAPPWPEIFGQDTERKQDFAEAVATHAAMIRTYTALGYELLELPLASVENRARFIRARLGD